MVQLINVINFLKLYVQDGRNDRGASAVEYAIVVALIAGILVATVALLGNQVLGMFQVACAQINQGVAC